MPCFIVLIVSGAMIPKNINVVRGSCSPVLRFRSLNRFGHWNFGNLILFKIWHLVLRISPLGRGDLYEEGKARYQVKAG